ncbi:amidohydrolase [Sulfodiicoccus acidiphilus]|uniref:Amidohydrolase n=1 Tax=Sulfodiicoccus acidiphilus TaxID=1670455 RepID=A0A348B6U0_9CREN|nr:amidohydrolase family protein [Sulfodiicoccus acidiphilus]BBD73892.1 amidohydrolase [Sulfodiicoccus acidiphilus]GGT96054.1 amidohydrolase [Sulfodiicoccus acidiphilus]
MDSVIVSGKAFDGRSFREDVEVRVERGEIERVGRSNGEKSLSGDYVILPGLIDAHVHFFGVKEDRLLEWNLVPETLATARSVGDAIRLLSAGFTTVRDLGSKCALGLAEAIEEGRLLGPRIVASGYSIAETGGNDDPRDLPLEMGQSISYSFYCDSPWECRKAVRKCVRQGADVIKVYASGAFSSGGKIKPAFTLEELRAIVDEAHRADLKVAMHAYGEEAIGNALDAGADTIEHGLGLSESLAKEMARKGICYVPTLATYEVGLEVRKMNEEVRKARSELIRKHMEEDVKIARDNGVTIIAGTDYVGSSSRRHGENYREIVLLAKFLGLEGALRAASFDAALCLGLRGGSLEVGKWGDLALFKKVEDPSDLRPDNLEYIVIRGRAINGPQLRELARWVQY